MKNDVNGKGSKVQKAYSWYFRPVDPLLCVGPAGMGDVNWRELEDATVDIERGHMVITADWSRHVMEHHAMRVHSKHNLPLSTKLDRKIPNMEEV